MMAALRRTMENPHFLYYHKHIKTWLHTSHPTQHGPQPSLPYHIVQMSPWPLITSAGAGFIPVSLVWWFSHMSYSNTSLILTFTPVALASMCWWRDVIREATFMGDHSSNIQTTLSLSMLLFITSEVMFFSAFFWAFFHSSLSPSPEIGCVWPPTGIYPLNPFATPLLNTAILLSSGLSVTWAHENMISGNLEESILSLTITIFLGIYFTLLQYTEYLEAEFSFHDSVYGSTFFIATGFHGCHVIIGTLFLMVCNWRLMKMHFSQNHHMGFEMAAWYWHFVDVVWLFLFVCVYWWTS